MLGLALQAAGSSDSVDQVAEGVGLAARRILAAYKGVNAALEGFGCIMKQHQALQVREGAMQDGRMLNPSFSFAMLSWLWCLLVPLVQISG